MPPFTTLELADIKKIRLDFAPFQRSKIWLLFHLIHPLLLGPNPGDSRPK